MLRTLDVQGPRFFVGEGDVVIDVSHVQEGRLPEERRGLPEVIVLLVGLVVVGVVGGRIEVRVHAVPEC